MSRESGDSEIIERRIAATLADYPVRLGLLFGSQARGTTHEQSDIDVAVVFDGLEPGDSGYTDTLLGLGADLAIELGTDEVDVVDLRRAPSTLVRAAFNDGKILVGDKNEAKELREYLLADTEQEQQSPAQQFDETLSRIDDHLA